LDSVDTVSQGSLPGLEAPESPERVPSSFSALVEARFAKYRSGIPPSSGSARSADAENADWLEFERALSKAEDRYQATLEAFTQEHGEIIHEYWSNSRPGGVAVTVKPQYHAWLPRVQRGQVEFYRFTDYLTRQFPEADELLFAGDALAAICQEVLRGPTQRIALTQVYMAASQLVSSLDAVVSQEGITYEPSAYDSYDLYEWYESGELEDEERKRREERRKEREAHAEERRRALKEEREKKEAEEKAEADKRLLRAANGYRISLSRAERFYRDGAEQSAQFYYFMGMLIGAAVVSASVLVVTLLLPYLVDLWGLDLSKKDAAAAFAVAVAGALGACVSVMWRMTAGTFREDAVFGADNLKRLGGFRPFLGAMFGLILYVAVRTPSKRGTRQSTRPIRRGSQCVRSRRPRA
jgi:hypothetical protein